jgi:hypothetical protein
MKMEDVQCLERAETWFKSEVLWKRLGIESVTDVMRRGRLRWYGHVERKNDEDWTSKCRYIEVEGKRRKGKGKKTWGEGLAHDMKLFGMTKEMAQDRTSS